MLALMGVAAAGDSGPVSATLAAGHGVPGPLPLPLALSLSKGCSSSTPKEGQCFDKLSTNGARSGERPDNLATYFTARATQDDAATAAKAYAAVLPTAPDPLVAIRAYRAAMLAGDLDLAARAAAILASANVAPVDAALLPIATAARANGPAALTRAAAPLADTPLAILQPALAAWARYAADGAVPPPAADPDPTARRLNAETRALLLIAAGRIDEGLAAVTTTGGGSPPIDLRIAAAQLLFAAGRDEAARTLLTGDGLVLARLREGTSARASLGWGVALLLARVAGDLEGAETIPLRLALTRAALAADPAHDRARLLLAATLTDADEPDLALGELAKVASNGPWSTAAIDARITVLARADRLPAALAAAKTEAESDRPVAWERYAGLLAAAGRSAEAIPWYRRSVDGPDKDRWQSWAELGNALDEAGRWAEAKRALDRAVALAPDEPLALNNAGYARVEHGDYREGTRLLERAARLAPDDTSIADSLGWAYHLAGDHARALPLIERAARDQPDNAEIADHLGDVYWRLGRRYEARYAWAAARLVADPAQGRALALKIENGL